MKSSIYLGTLAFALLVFAAWRYSEAEMMEWDLRNRVPTNSVEESKRLRVFAEEFEASPAMVDLGDTTYRIERLWIEHRAEAQRRSIFSTRQEILPDLVLRVRVTEVARNPQLARTGIRIKAENGRETYGDGMSRDLLLANVGHSIPASFVLRSDTRDREVIVQLKKKLD